MVGEIIEDNKVPLHKKGGEIAGPEKLTLAVQSTHISDNCAKQLKGLVSCLYEARCIYVSLYAKALSNDAKSSMEKWEGMLMGTDSLIKRYKDFMRTFAKGELDFDGLEKEFKFESFSSRLHGTNAAIKAESNCLEECMRLAEMADKKKDYLTTSLLMSTLRIHAKCITKLRSI
jgi:hypothetical protein